MRRRSVLVSVGLLTGIAMFADVIPAIGAKSSTGMVVEFNPTIDPSAICHTLTGALDYDWGNSSPGGTCPSDDFEGRGSGYIIAPFTGTVEFCGSHDDGMSLSVDNTVVFSNLTDQGPSDPCNTTGTIDLVAGNCYPLEMYFYERGGGAVLKLKWSWTDTPYEIIPASAYVTSCDSRSGGGSGVGGGGSGGSGGNSGSGSGEGTGGSGGGGGGQGTGGSGGGGKK